jgi:hypothetical protein
VPTAGMTPTAIPKTRTEDTDTRCRVGTASSRPPAASSAHNRVGLPSDRPPAIAADERRRGVDHERGLVGVGGYAAEVCGELATEPELRARRRFYVWLGLTIAGFVLTAAGAVVLAVVLPSVVT